MHYLLFALALTVPACSGEKYRPAKPPEEREPAVTGKPGKKGEGFERVAVADEPLAPPAFDAKDAKRTLRWLHGESTKLHEVRKKDNEFATKEEESRFQKLVDGLVGREVEWAIPLYEITTQVSLDARCGSAPSAGASAASATGTWRTSARSTSVISRRRQRRCGPWRWQSSGRTRRAGRRESGTGERRGVSRTRTPLFRLSCPAGAGDCRHAGLLVSQLRRISPEVSAKTGDRLTQAAQRRVRS
jgi:hypothetical protein